MQNGNQINQENNSRYALPPKFKHMSSFDAVDPTEINQLVHQEGSSLGDGESNVNRAAGGVPGSVDIVMNQAEFSSIPNEPPKLHIEMKDRSSPPS